MLTCKRFLEELSGYLEKTLDPADLVELQRHVNECPNCFVVCDTTQKTLKVFKGMEAQPMPKGVTMWNQPAWATPLKSIRPRARHRTEPATTPNRTAMWLRKPLVKRVRTRMTASTNSAMLR